MRVLVDLQTQSRKHTAKCGTRDEARREVPPKATHDALTLYSPNNHNHAHPAHAHRQDRRAGSLSRRSCCARLRGHAGKRGASNHTKQEGRKDDDDHDDHDHQDQESTGHCRLSPPPAARLLVASRRHAGVFRGGPHQLVPDETTRGARGGGWKKSGEQQQQQQC